ncbi:MAG: DUF3127 domain-containing protein [Bacteroidales bacterium]|jgi:hypothetical protein|nr:DUF3127 domain-containing protein [Bacteroidales bacterium]
MEFTAKLVQIREPQTGEGRNGPWKRQEYIFETDGQYAKKICITVWGDRAIQDPSIMQIGALLDVHFDLESREHNDRWYSDIKAWKIVKHGENVNAGGYNANAGYAGGNNGNNYGNAPAVTAAPVPAETPVSAPIAAETVPADAVAAAADDLPF